MERIVYSRQVTVIRVRFAQQDGSDFPFDATAGPGYVWHCHILEHEDNEMMRPYTLTRITAPVFFEVPLIAIVTLITALVIGFLSLRSLHSRSSRKPVKQGTQNCSIVPLQLLTINQASPMNYLFLLVNNLGHVFCHFGKGLNDDLRHFLSVH